MIGYDGEVYYRAGLAPFLRMEMNCPKCGKEMEHGYLQIPTAELTNLVWLDKKYEPSMVQSDVKRVVIRDHNYHQMEGYRCPSDRIIAFEY